MTVWVTAFIVWGVTSRARADFVVVTSSGSIEYSVRGSAGIGEGTSFGGLGELLTAGAGYPILAEPTGPVQTITGTLEPGLSLDASPSLIGTGQFGSGRTTLRALGSSTGAGVNRAGTFWTPAFVSDLGADGFHSVMISTSIVTFRNDSTLAVSGVPGSLLSVTGTLGGEVGDYLAAALTGSITVGEGPEIAFAPVVIAYDGATSLPGTQGDLADFVQSGTFGVLTPNGLSFSAVGVSRGSTVTIEAGQTFTLRGTLTLIADPSSIEMAMVPDIALPFAPDFSVTSAAPVPEPTSLCLLGAGLVAVVLVRKRLGRG